MTATIRKIVFAGMEVPIDTNEEVLVRMAEQMEAMERTENFDCVMSTTSAQSTAGNWMPSRPLNPTGIKVIDSVLRSNVRESAIRRDRDGDL
jgi:hypothetical protein